MKIMKYFPEDDVLYIRIRSGKYSESDPVSDNIILDLDSKGNTLGIEILHASKEPGKAQLPIN